MADKFVFKVGKEKKFTGSFLPQFMTMKLSIVPAGCYFKSIERPKVDWTVYVMAELSIVQNVGQRIFLLLNKLPRRA